MDRAVSHVIQTILSQVVDVNNHIRQQQENTELDEGSKIATTNFGNYHLMVLSILMHDLAGIAREKFPDAKPIIDWAEQHYNFGLANNSFKPCQCEPCKKEADEKKLIEENDKKILDS